MKRLLSFALAALWIAPAAHPGTETHAAWKWERSITPNAGSPAAEQCAVLDAALFADAAPGLRDVRLMQDGRELPYATDISLDDRRSHPGATTAADRALYEIAMVVPAYPTNRVQPGTQEKFPGLDHPPGSFYGKGILPAHVPVERIRLDSAERGTEFLGLRAAETTNLANPETIDATLTPESPAVAFTVGANLQQSAEVGLGVHGESTKVSAFVLEMRRREICYQPLTASPVTLLFGNARALPVRYEFGKVFQPKATPVMASMGPIQRNPAYREPGAPTGHLSLRTRLVLGVLACACALALTLRPLLRPRR